MDHDTPLTQLLMRVARGDRDADAALAEAVLARLEQIAAGELASRNHGGLHGLTIEPAMLAHDALLKLIEQPREFENRRHFFAYATQVMANAVISHLRKRNAAKRGGGMIAISLAGLSGDEVAAEELEEVPVALRELEALDQRKADLVGLRVFWGASMEEAAGLLGISMSTAERDWRFSRRWLAVRLQQGEPEGKDPATGPA